MQRIGAGSVVCFLMCLTTPIRGYSHSTQGHKVVDDAVDYVHSLMTPSMKSAEAFSFLGGESDYETAVNQVCDHVVDKFRPVVEGLTLERPQQQAIYQLARGYQSAEVMSTLVAQCLEPEPEPELDTPAIDSSCEWFNKMFANQLGDLGSYNTGAGSAGVTDFHGVAEVDREQFLDRVSSVFSYMLASHVMSIPQNLCDFVISDIGEMILGTNNGKSSGCNLEEGKCLPFIAASASGRVTGICNLGEADDILTDKTVLTKVSPTQFAFQIFKKTNYHLPITVDANVTWIDEPEVGGGENAGAFESLGTSDILNMNTEELINFASAKGTYVVVPQESLELVGEFPDGVQEQKTNILFQHMAKAMSKAQLKQQSLPPPLVWSGFSIVNPKFAVANKNPAKLRIDAYLENGGPQSMTYSLNAPFTDSDWNLQLVNTCLERVEYRHVELKIKKCEVSSLILHNAEMHPICPASSQCPYGKSNKAKRWICYLFCELLEWKLCRDSTRKLVHVFDNVDPTKDFNFFINKELPICKKSLSDFDHKSLPGGGQKQQQH